MYSCQNGFVKSRLYQTKFSFFLLKFLKYYVQLWARQYSGKLQKVQ